MKFIHCSDIHIDSKMQTHLSSHQAIERKREILLTFERMVEFARDNDVKGIIIAGDMFDTSNVSMSTKRRIQELISNNQEIDFLYLAGNHDEENLLEELSGLNNLKVFGDQWTSFLYDNIVITGAKLNKNTNFDLLSLKKDNVNIVVLHGQISQYNIRESDEIIPLPALKDKNIDYLALGHIHTFESHSIDHRGLYAYSGCLEGRGFDECGDKGFVIIDIDGGKVEYKFMPFASRKLYEIEFDISNYSDWFEIESEIFERLEDIDFSSMVKIIIVGKFTLSMQKHIELCEKRLCEKFYFAKIKDNSTLKLNDLDYMNDYSLRGEYIRQVMNSNLSKDEKDKLILMGVKALDGEELC